jgi:arsenate reductase
MAEALLQHDAGEKIEVFSAGTNPSHVRQEAIEVMREIGIDISGHRSKGVGEFLGQEFAYVITVCDRANEQCPIFPGKTRRVHWPLEDPARATGPPGEIREVFRRSRDEIDRLVKEFLSSFES